MTNPARGEVEISFAGNARYTLRPSFSALCAVEHATGKGIIALAMALNDGALRLNDMAAIIHHCAVAAGGKDMPDASTIGEMITATGMTACISPLVRLFAGVLGGEADA